MESSTPNTEVMGQGPERLMDMEQLRAEFRRWRGDRGRSQVSIAEELGITQASLSAWETGKSQSLRAPTLNEVIHLIDRWRADSNIVHIPAARMKAATRGHDKPVPEVRSPSRERAREKMMEAVRSKLGSGAPSADVLADLSGKDLLDVYIFSKLE